MAMMPYDALGRLTLSDYPAGTPDVGFQYNAASQVITMTDGLGQTVYGYDALGRMTSRSRDGRTVGYTYTATGQVAVEGTGACAPILVRPCPNRR